MRLVLAGAGGHASDLLGLIEDLSRLAKMEFECVIVTDDKLDRPDRFENREVQVVVGEGRAFRLATHFIAARGYPEARKATALRALEFGLEPCTPLAHPLGNRNPSVSIGEGSVVLALCSMSPRVKIGRHCYISHGVLIGHDTRIGDYSSVMPGASISGDVEIGECVLVGAGAIVLEKVTVGHGATIGAGSVVVKDVPAGETVIGVPARKRP